MQNILLNYFFNWKKINLKEPSGESLETVSMSDILCRFDTVFDTVLRLPSSPWHKLHVWPLPIPSWFAVPPFHCIPLLAACDDSKAVFPCLTRFEDVLMTTYQTLQPAYIPYLSRLMFYEWNFFSGCFKSSVSYCLMVSLSIQIANPKTGVLMPNPLWAILEMSLIQSLLSIPTDTISAQVLTTST